jgi:hypothetical protein
LVSYRNDLKAAAAAGQSENTNAAEGHIQKSNHYRDRTSWSHEVLDALLHLEYVCDQQPARDRNWRLDQPEQRHN